MLEAIFGDQSVRTLAVGRRHRLDAGRLDGLVLLDLPDFDSIEASHRLEAERIVALADLVLWVVELQKYADASLHQRYLRPLATHSAAMAIVLNQADLLVSAEVDSVRDDRADGLPGLPLFVVSASTGDGIPELRRLIAERVAARDAAIVRLAADLEGAAAALAAGCQGEPRGLRRQDTVRLVEALEGAAGVPTVRSRRRECAPASRCARDGLAVRPLAPPFPARPPFGSDAASANARAAARTPLVSVVLLVWRQGSGVAEDLEVKQRGAVMESDDVWGYRDQAQLGYDPTTGSDITGYGVEARDGSIGKIDKANNDVGRSYVIVDTGPWIFGKKVMLPAGVIERVDSDDEKVYVNRTKDQIKDAPEYDDAMASDEGYQGELGRYYGAGGPGYRDWENSI